MSLDHSQRYGNFTSSQIGHLCTSDKKGGFGKPALNYIQDKVFETRLGQRIDTETSAKSTTWGTLAEAWAHSKLDMWWELVSDKTISHESIEFWSGSPDLTRIKDNIKTVGDIKCPFTKKSYATLADICISKDLDKFKDEYPLYFWQLISNSVLVKATHAELIITMPYLEELSEIRDLANSANDEDKYQYFWVSAAKDNQLPFLIKGNYYLNSYSLNFQVPGNDVDFLTERIKLANLERLKF